MTSDVALPLSLWLPYRRVGNRKTLRNRRRSLTCLLKTATSSLKESDEHTSPPATPGSRGVHVASSHFSNINANSGKSGCLEGEIESD